jgi:hypothetical protein
MMQIVMVLAPPLTVLISLMLRLWWQARRDKQHQHTLHTLTRLLPQKGVIEIHDVRDDGSRLLMRVDSRPERQTDKP